MRPAPYRPARRDPFAEMLSWPDADLRRVEELRRDLEGQGRPRAEAAREAAMMVRQERLARRNAW